MCFAFAALAGPIAFAAEPPALLQGEGAAPGSGPSAREAAIAEAKTRLVLDHLEQYVRSRDLSLFDSIVNSAADYFDSVRVIRETTEQGETHIEIEAHIKDARLRADAAALILTRHLEPPKVIVVILDKRPGSDAAEKNVAETALTESLHRARFEVVPAKTLHDRYSGDALTACVDGEPDVGGSLGREFFAPIVVLGSVEVVSAAPDAGTNLLQCTATMKLRVVRAADASVISDLKVDALVHGSNEAETGDQAIRDACDKVVNDVLSSAAFGMLKASPSSDLVVTIEKLGGAERLEAIVKSIKDFPSVSGVKTLYHSDQTARLRIDYAGPVAPFVDRLASAHFQGFSLRANNVIDRDMTVSIVQ